MLAMIGLISFFGVFLCAGMYLTGYHKGKRQAILEAKERGHDNAIKIKKRFNKRSSAGVAAVDKWLHKYSDNK